MSVSSNVLTPPRLLLSFAYLQQPILQQLYHGLKHHLEIMVDSGAFTVFANRRHRLSGRSDTVRTVSLDDYVAFCKAERANLWQYVALDVIRNPEGTTRNLQTMVDAGLRPMPVIIEGYTPEQISGLLEVNEHLCVAGTAYGTTEYRAQRVLWADALLHGQGKLHALGYSTTPHIFYLPLASSDSTTFVNGCRFGQVHLFDRVDRIFYYNPRAPRARSRWFGYASTHGLSNREILDTTCYNGANGWQAIATANSYVELADALWKRREQRLFQATTGVHDLMRIVMLWAQRARDGDLHLGKAKTLRLFIIEQWKLDRKACIRSMTRALEGEYGHLPG